MNALRQLKKDQSNDGFQAIASFHGLPARCPTPAEGAVACCQHGMPTFPHWHRLYTLQFEEALRREGSSVAVPYWDWTGSFDKLPELLTRSNYYDPWTDDVVENPFQRGYIESADTYTVRDVQPELFQRQEHTIEYVLLALEQEDFCDFAVQFEVVHNAIHYLLGGHHEYSLSSLHYAAYDPAFFIHHSNVDRIWAIWQALQDYRGLPSKTAYCALNYMSSPMKPFSFDADINPNAHTRKHAVPNEVFDYEHLGYTYDTLELDGMSIPELSERIESGKNHARVFAGFLLKGLGVSADVHFHICHQDNCVFAGYIFMLGGAAEMPWAYDRLYKHDITDALKEAGIQPEDLFSAEEPFTWKVDIFAVDGKKLDSHVIPAPTIIYQPAKGRVNFNAP